MSFLLFLYILPTDWRW